MLKTVRIQWNVIVVVVGDDAYYWVLLVLRPSISSLLQSTTAYFITKCDSLLLQSATILLQSATEHGRGD